MPLPIDLAETKCITYAAPRMTANELWNPKSGKDREHVDRDELSLQRKAAKKFKQDAERRPDSGYKRRYQAYVKRVTKYNAEVDQWNEDGNKYRLAWEKENPEKEAFEHTELKPSGTAWFLESTLPFDEQVSLVRSWEAEGKLLHDERTKPRLSKAGLSHTAGGHIEWSTNHVCLVPEKSLLCYQALMVAIMTCDLASAGVPTVAPPEKLRLKKDIELQGACFAEINHFFDMASGSGSAFFLAPPLVRIVDVLDVFRRTFGFFAIHVWHYHEEDIEHAEAGIPHYVTYNATTRLLQCYPEVCSCCMYAQVPCAPPYGLVSMLVHRCSLWKTPTSTTRRASWSCSRSHRCSCSSTPPLGKALDGCGRHLYISTRSSCSTFRTATPGMSRGTSTATREPSIAGGVALSF